MYSDADLRGKSLTLRSCSLKYTQPQLRSIDSGWAAGVCNSGPTNQGHCGYGNVAEPGSCSFGQYASGNCNTGYNPQLKKFVYCVTGGTPTVP